MDWYIKQNHFQNLHAEHQAKDQMTSSMLQVAKTRRTDCYHVDDTKRIIAVTIWKPSGDTEDFASKLNGDAVRIFGFVTGFYQDVLQLTTLSDFKIYPAGTTERAKALESGQETLLKMATDELTTLTGVPSLLTDLPSAAPQRSLDNEWKENFLQVYDAGFEPRLRSFCASGSCFDKG